jgi:hypothetical protein
MTCDDQIVRADLRWLTQEQGGRFAPPLGPTYSSVARFSVQSDDEWMKEAWRVVVIFISEPDLERRHEVAIRFLVPEAPQDYLSPGSRFSLMEGMRAVAEGIVRAGIRTAT